MKFGPVPPRDAEGAVAVHSIRKGDLVLKKGTLIGKAEIAALEAAGIDEIVVARVEASDVSEDMSAAEIAEAVAGEGVRVDRAFTGRANLFAEEAGVLVVDKDAVDRLNEVDPAITFATLPAYAPVVAGKMIATVKIIPFAVERAAHEAALKVARACAAGARGALPGEEGRRDFHTAAGPRRQGDRQDAARHARSARAGRCEYRRGAARAA